MDIIKPDIATQTGNDDGGKEGFPGTSSVGKVCTRLSVHVALFRANIRLRFDVHR